MIYASTLCPPGGQEDKDIQRLDEGVARLLDVLRLPGLNPEVLWSLKYRAKGRPIDTEAGPILSSNSGRLMTFPPPSIDLAFDDSILKDVREVWKRIMGDEVEDSDFLKFAERGVENEEES